MIIMLAPFVALYNGNLSYEGTSLEISVFERSLDIGFETPSRHNSFLNTDIPYVEFYFNVNGEKAIVQTMSFLPFEMILEDPPISVNNENSDIEVSSPLHQLYFLNMESHEGEIPVNFGYNGGEDVYFKYSITRVEGEEEHSTEYTDEVWSEGDNVTLEEEGLYRLDIEVFESETDSKIASREVTFGVINVVETAKGFALVMGINAAILTMINANIRLIETPVEEARNFFFILGALLSVYGLINLFLKDSLSKWWGAFWGILFNLIALGSLIASKRFFKEMKPLEWVDKVRFFEVWAKRFHIISVILEVFEILVEGTENERDNVLPEELQEILGEGATIFATLTWAFSFFGLSATLHRPGNWDEGKISLYGVTGATLIMQVLVLLKFIDNEWPLL